MHFYKLLIQIIVLWSDPVLFLKFGIHFIIIIFFKWSGSWIIHLGNQVFNTTGLSRFCKPAIFGHRAELDNHIDRIQKATVGVFSGPWMLCKAVCRVHLAVDVLMKDEYLFLPRQSLW